MKTSKCSPATNPTTAHLNVAIKQPLALNQYFAHSTSTVRVPCLPAFAVPFAVMRRGLTQNPFDITGADGTGVVTLQSRTSSLLYQGVSVSEVPQ